MISVAVAEVGSPRNLCWTLDATPLMGMFASFNYGLKHPNRKLPLIFLPRTADKKNNSTNQRQASDDRRKRNVPLDVFCGVNRTQVNNLFTARVVNALIGKRERAQNHQQNPSQET